MTSKELSKMKEGDAIYDRSDKMSYCVVKLFKRGVFVYREYTSPNGRFAEYKILKKTELLCDDMILC